MPFFKARECTSDGVSVQIIKRGYYSLFSSHVEISIVAKNSGITRVL